VPIEDLREEIKEKYFKRSGLFMRDYKLYLKDILEAMEKIEEFVKDMDLEAFKNDDKTQSAVIRKFEVIGEATKNISQEIKDKYNSIPWKEMAGIRDN